MKIKHLFGVLALAAVTIFAFLTATSLKTGSPEKISRAEGTTVSEPEFNGVPQSYAADRPSSADVREDTDRMEEELSSFQEYADALNKVRSGYHKQAGIPDLYDLLDDLVLVYHGDPVIYLAMRKVRVELARRGETEPLALIVDTANNAEAGAAGDAIADLAKSAQTKPLTTSLPC